MKNVFRVTAFFLAMLAGSFVSAAPLTAENLGTIQADTLANIALAGGVGAIILATGLGWDVGLSLVKKFAKKFAK